jgi:hypothetical protein
MYTLKDADGATVNQKNGEPFTYFNRTLAEIGKRVLEGERRVRLTIVEK